MTKDEIFTRAKNILIDKYDAEDDVLKHHNLALDIDLDSLDRLEFLMDLEVEFSVIIEDDRAEQLVTVSDYVDEVNRLLIKKLKD